MAADPFEERRAAILQESIDQNRDATDSRWGYFSIPGPLAIGDNSYAPRATRKPPPEDEGGEPIKNITTNPVKRGAGPDVYFEFATPLCRGDPYRDPSSINAKGKVTMLFEDAKFKPPGKVTYPLHRGIEYPDVPTEDYKDPKETKERLSAEGGIPPKQITTNPARKGGGGVLTRGVLFGHSEDREAIAPPPDGLVDDYDAAKKLRAKELEEHREKLQDQPFKTMVYGNNAFFQDSDVYHYDIPTHIPREPKVEVFNIPEDRAPFKPSNPTKKGILHGLMAEVPPWEWQEDPVPGGAVRKPKDEDAKAAFKPYHPRQQTNPMPSVTTNLRNMRNERPSSFARPCL